MTVRLPAISGSSPTAPKPGFVYVTSTPRGGKSFWERFMRFPPVSGVGLGIRWVVLDEAHHFVAGLTASVDLAEPVRQWQERPRGGASELLDGRASQRAKASCKPHPALLTMVRRLDTTSRGSW